MFPKLAAWRFLDNAHTKYVLGCSCSKALTNATAPKSTLSFNDVFQNISETFRIVSPRTFPKSF